LCIAAPRDLPGNRGGFAAAGPPFTAAKAEPVNSFISTLADRRRERHREGAAW
jgi:hypothetical protein